MYCRNWSTCNWSGSAAAGAPKPAASGLRLHRGQRDWRRIRGRAPWYLQTGTMKASTVCSDGQLWVSREVLLHPDFCLSCQLQRVADHFGQQEGNDAKGHVPIDWKVLQMWPTVQPMRCVEGCPWAHGGSFQISSLISDTFVIIGGQCILLV